MLSFLSLTSAEAEVALNAATTAADLHGCTVSIAVVDHRGALLAFRRMDGARSYTVDLALEKARSAAIVGVPSAVLAAAGAKDIAAGGLPMLVGPGCVGAIGVSGAQPVDDVTIAEAGAAAPQLN